MQRSVTLSSAEALSHLTVEVSVLFIYLDNGPNAKRHGQTRFPVRYDCADIRVQQRPVTVIVVRSALSTLTFSDLRGRRRVELGSSLVAADSDLHLERPLGARLLDGGHRLLERVGGRDEGREVEAYTPRDRRDTAEMQPRCSRNQPRG